MNPGILITLMVLSVGFYFSVVVFMARKVREEDQQRLKNWRFMFIALEAKQYAKPGTPEYNKAVLGLLEKEGLLDKER